jgi:hypothetical protein
MPFFLLKGNLIEKNKRTIIFNDDHSLLQITNEWARPAR